MHLIRPTTDKLSDIFHKISYVSMIRQTISSFFFVSQLMVCVIFPVEQLQTLLTLVNFTRDIFLNVFKKLWRNMILLLGGCLVESLYSFFILFFFLLAFSFFLLKGVLTRLNISFKLASNCPCALISNTYLTV